ncbi:MAG TPA: zinc ribbon domain-containing protein [Pyrinomonadaceae bacterium]|nr:zinc ribbon domain-containing protein [Pyrinomonadaceae bacterium]
MFCPRCGQQQISGEVRFCPRCGLSLASVPALLAGFEAALTEGKARGGRSKKRKQMRRGAKLMFLSAVLFPIFFGIAISGDGPGPLIVPVTVFFAGLAWMLYFVLFGEEDAQEPADARGTEVLRESRTAPPLPPATFVPASGFGARRANTADMAQPPSVTEQTTRLLDEE